MGNDQFEKGGVCKADGGFKFQCSTGILPVKNRLEACFTFYRRIRVLIKRTKYFILPEC